MPAVRTPLRLDAVLFAKITLVGVGLLGGSLGRAVKKRRLAERVVGYVRREASLEECRRTEAVDEATLDLAEAVADAEALILCTPIGSLRPLAERLAPLLAPGTLITDVASTKASPAAMLEPVFADVDCHFIGSHPMAGAEKTGVNNAREDLFEGATCVITPTPTSNTTAVKRVTALWEGVGATPLMLSPEVHDELVSRSSHLPHLVAAQLVTLALDPRHGPEQQQLCATGFRDCTRVASGSPEMWRDIAVANSKHLSTAISDLMAELGAFRDKLSDPDGEAILDFLRRARERREAWLENSPGLR